MSNVNSASNQIIDLASMDAVFKAANNAVYGVAPMTASLLLKNYCEAMMNEEKRRMEYNADDSQQAAIVGTVIASVLGTVIKQTMKGAPMDESQLDETTILVHTRTLEANPNAICYNPKLADVVTLMYELGYLTKVQSDVRGIGCDYIVATRQAYNVLFKVSALLPQYEPIMGTEDRRTRKASPLDKKAFLKGLNVVKGGANPNRKLKEAISFLQETPFLCDEYMLGLANVLLTHVDYSQHEKIKSAKFVIDACNKIEASRELFTEFGTDRRGRLMPSSFGAPNLQAGDLNRSLYSVVSTKGSLPNDKGVKLFKAEMLEAAGFPLDMKSIRIINADPIQFLKDCLDGIVNCPEPFKLVKMCKEMVEAQAAWANAEGYIFHTPVGLDAKSSGTQILSIMSGDLVMADRCGITDILRNDKERKEADPYAESGRKAKAIIGMELSRNDMKTPYMAIQYGGSALAIYENKNFRTFCHNKGIFDNEEIMLLAEGMAAACKAALGNNINDMISSIEYNVYKKCSEMGVSSFEYKHLDGFLVRLDDREVYYAAWAGEINRGDRGTPVKFGSVNEETGAVNWTISQEKTAGEFVRKFVVHFVQGLDAMLARTVAVNAKAAGIEGYATIHDCFRSSVADAEKLLPVIQQSYLEIFTDGKVMDLLESQIGKLNGYIAPNGDWIPYTRCAPIPTELFTAENSYYFC